MLILAYLLTQDGQISQVSLGNPRNAQAHARSKFAMATFLSLAICKTMPFLMRFQHVEGFIIAISIFYLGYYYLQPILPLPEEDDFTSKLRYLIHCSIVPSSTFLYAIGDVLRKRSQHAVVNPLTGRENLLQLQHNFAQNTLEQLTVFLISSAILATYLVGEQLKLITLNAIVFTVGRILFRVGYGIHPKYRGVGVWCFFTGQALVLGLCVYFFYTHGIMHGLEDATYTLPPNTPENLAKQEL